MHPLVLACKYDQSLRLVALILNVIHRTNPGSRYCRWFLVSFQPKSTSVLPKRWFRMAKEEEWEDH